MRLPVFVAAAAALLAAGSALACEDYNASSAANRLPASLAAAPAATPLPAKATRTAPSSATAARKAEGSTLSQASEKAAAGASRQVATNTRKD